MPSCELCVRVACRGGFQCPSFIQLNELKLQTITNYAWSLDLSGLKLKSLPRDYFQGLSIESVNLSNNDFEYLPWWTFEHLYDLRRITITNNPRLYAVSDAVALVSETLQKLHCENCPRLGWDTWLLHMTFPSLHTLILEKCGIKHIPGTSIESRAWKAPYLNYLNLSGNLIKTIKPNTFKFIPRLKSLYLDGNRLTTFDPACLSTSCRLSHLDLAHNRIHTIPALGAFPTLTSLAGLDLADNRLHHLSPNMFAGLTRLTSLVLMNNYLTALQEGLFTTQPHFFNVYLNGNKRLFYIDPRCFINPVYLDAKEETALALQGSGYEFLRDLLEAQAELEVAIKKSRFAAFHEDLMMAVFHPDRIEKLIAVHGLEVMEVF